MKTSVGIVINAIKRGGPSNVVLNLLRELDSSRYEAVLITLFEENDPALIEESRQYSHVIELAHHDRVKMLLSGRMEIEKIIEKYHIAIVHSHGLVADTLSAKLRLPVKRIATVHCNIFEDYVYTYGRLKKEILTWFQIRMLRQLDSCVCCSESVYNALRPYLSNAMFIRNGINADSRKLPASKADILIPKDSITYVYVGHLSNRKRAKWLVSQFHQYREENEYLLVLGDGPDRKECSCIRDEHIKFLGFVDDPQIYLSMADIYVSASASEGLSMSIIEALANGLGLLLSDIPSHREVFDVMGQYCGELFRGDELHEALERLRINYGSLEREEIKRRQNAYLSATVMTREYEKVYSKLQTELIDGQ